MTNEKMNKPIEKRDCHVCHHKYPDMIYCSACGPRCNSCYINRELHIKALEDEMGFLCDKNMEYHNRVIELEDELANEKDIYKDFSREDLKKMSDDLNYAKDAKDGKVEQLAKDIASIGYASGGAELVLARELISLGYGKVKALEDEIAKLKQVCQVVNMAKNNVLKQNKALMELLEMADHRIGMEVCDCVEDRVCLRCQWLRKHKEIKNGQRDPI